MMIRAVTACVALLAAAAVGSAQPAQVTKTKVRPGIAQRKAWTATAQVRPIEAMILEDQKAAQDLDGRGPANRPLHLQDLSVEGLGSFPGVEGLQSITNLSLTLFPDANEASGLYYYLPSGYFLNWDPEEGYYLAMDYKYEQESGENVLIDARLSPGPVQDDRQFLLELLKSYLQQNGGATHPLEKTKLLELPATYEVRFDWGDLGVPELTVSGIDGVTREIALTLATEVGTRQMLASKLGSKLGLRGEVEIVPHAVTEGQPPLPNQIVHARLMLTDDAYAEQRWQRSTEEHSVFQNHHPFPVKLKHLCYLYRAPDELKLRGYDLGDALLGPGDAAKLPNAKITNQIDDSERVLRAWYVYSLVNDETSREQVISELTGGIGSLPVKRISIEVLSSEELFSQYHLYKLVVLVRSRFFDPRNEEEIENSYELGAGDAGLELAPLYVPAEVAEPLYRYRIGLVTAAAEQFLDDEWRLPGALGDILIGSTQVEEVLGGR
jgi:hypothetical protein